MLKKQTSDYQKVLEFTSALKPRFGWTFGCKKMLPNVHFLHRELHVSILLCSRTPHPKGSGFNVRDIIIDKEKQES